MMQQQVWGHAQGDQEQDALVAGDDFLEQMFGKMEIPTCKLTQ